MEQQQKQPDGLGNRAYASGRRWMLRLKALLAFGAGMCLAAAPFAGTDAQAAESTRPPAGATKPSPQVLKPAGKPDLIPVTDNGKINKFEKRWEWRHAFWAKNAGTATSPPSQIRLKFYYMDVTVWKLHADLVLDVPRLQPGQESRALVTRLVYREMYLWDVPSGQVEKQGNMHGYKWEFWVDSTNVVGESNEQNNHLGREGHYPHHGALETGPSGGFH